MLTVALTTLHSFDQDPTNGAYPEAGLTLVGSTLFGTTRGGGDDGLGTVFSMNPDGSDYQVLHSFTGAATDGQGPDGNLTLVGSTYRQQRRLGRRDFGRHNAGQHGEHGVGWRGDFDDTTASMVATTSRRPTRRCRTSIWPISGLNRL